MANYPGFCNRREDRDERGRYFFDVKSEGDAGTSYELFEEEKVRHRSSNPTSYCKFRDYKPLTILLLLTLLFYHHNPALSSHLAAPSEMSEELVAGELKKPPAAPQGISRRSTLKILASLGAFIAVPELFSSCFSNPHPDFRKKTQAALLDTLELLSEYSVHEKKYKSNKRKMISKYLAMALKSNDIRKEEYFPLTNALNELLNANEKLMLKLERNEQPSITETDDIINNKLARLNNILVPFGLLVNGFISPFQGMIFCYYRTNELIDFTLNDIHRTQKHVILAERMDKIRANDPDGFELNGYPVVVEGALQQTAIVLRKKYFAHVPNLNFDFESFKRILLLEVAVHQLQHSINRDSGLALADELWDEASAQLARLISSRFPSILINTLNELHSSAPANSLYKDSIGWIFGKFKAMNIDPLSASPENIKVAAKRIFEIEFGERFGYFAIPDINYPRFTHQPVPNSNVNKDLDYKDLNTAALKIIESYIKNLENGIFPKGDMRVRDYWESICIQHNPPEAVLEALTDKVILLMLPGIRSIIKETEMRGKVPDNAKIIELLKQGLKNEHKPVIIDSPIYAAGLISLIDDGSLLRTRRSVITGFRSFITAL